MIRFILLACIMSFCAGYWFNMPEEEGFTQDEILAMNALVEHVTAEDWLSQVAGGL